MTAYTSVALRRSPLTGILALFFLSPTSGLVAPDIANIAATFGVSTGQATWVMTISMIVTIPVSVITGIIAGKHVSFRALAIVGIVIYTVGGVLPAFIGPHWAVLLILRAVWGVGAGMIFTLANSLIVVTYADERQRARMFGLGTLVFSLGSVFTLILGGFLAAISWQTPFYGYAIGAAALVFVLPSLHIGRITEKASESGARQRRARMPVIAFLPLVCFMFALMGLFPMTSTMSVVFEQADLGSTSAVGLITALSTLAGFFVSLAFGRLYATLGRYVLPAGFVVAALGLMVLFLSSRTGGGYLPIYGMGVAIVGAGMMAATTGTPMVLSTIVPPSSGAAVQGLFGAALNLGAAISSIYVTVAIGALGGTDGLVRPIYVVSAILLVLLAVPLMLLAQRLPSAVRTETS